MAVMYGTMTGHPTQGMDTRGEALDDLSDDSVELDTVSGNGEQFFSMVPSEHHVIEAAGNMNTGKSWHPCTFQLSRDRGYASKASVGGRR
jgi:hypothetical protein